ncbi:phospho-N-acetylmuramoyl-pentapeptide-transferase, partial [Campylobacter coli]
MPKFINWAKKNASQPIYEHAPQNHQIKSHTPTMGGVIFVFCAIFASLLCIKFDNLFA